MTTATAALPPATPQTDDDLAGRALTNVGDNIRASWPFSLDSIRSNIAYMSPEAKELLVWAFTWCIDSAHPLRFDEFADRTGYSKNKFYKIYSGKDKHPTDDKEHAQFGKLMEPSTALLDAVRKFRRIELERAKLGRALFVMTPTAKKIFHACDLARESQTPVILYGASQIGKTEALKQYCIENNHGRTVLVELEAVSGLMGVLKAIAEKLGISPNANTPDLIARIKKALTPDMVLILDEVHLLANTYRKGSFFACMEELRRIFDFARCGLVMTFTLLGYTMAETHRKRELEQIFRRGVHKMNLGDRPSTQDIAALADGWVLEMPTRGDTITIGSGPKALTEQPYEMLKQLAQENGLKAIIERFRYGSKLAGEEDLTWEHVVKAHFMILKNATPPAHGWQS
jgi:DNA transposition AAA+ family ATPase